MKRKLSHFEQRYNRAPFSFTPVKLVQKVYVKTPKIDETTGLPTNNLELKTVNNDKIKTFKVSDFCIENLQISGAVNNLNSVTLDRDPLSQLSHLSATAESIVNSDINNKNK